MEDEPVLIAPWVMRHYRANRDRIATKSNSAICSGNPTRLEEDEKRFVCPEMMEREKLRAERSKTAMGAVL
jgi:hypothetical protein